MIMTLYIGQIPKWSEHFQGFISDQSSVQESLLAKIPQADVKLELEDPPTLEEIRDAAEGGQVTWQLQYSS